MINDFFILVDGSNIAFAVRTKRRKARCCNLEIIIQYLDSLKKRYPLDYEIITDASLKYAIDDTTRLKTFYKQGIINECPSKVKADQFILEYFSLDPEHTIIISNDNFSEYGFQEPHHYALCKFMIINKKILIHKFNGLLEELKTDGECKSLKYLSAIS